MTQFKKIILASAAVLALAPAAVKADGHKDIVLDFRGERITDFRGNCVFTKWDASTDVCAQKSANQQPGTYLVFFDFNKSEITPEAREVLRIASMNYAANPVTRIEVVGHADRSGSAAYNKKISQRRADAVKKVLSQMGISRKQIKVYAKGEVDPLVPTEDGVREPQNRRVEVIFKDEPVAKAAPAKKKESKAKKQQ